MAEIFKEKLSKKEIGRIKYMSNNKLAGKVQTVLGPISPENLGITLIHEHCLSDASAWFNEPKEASKKGLAYQKVKLENLGWVR